MTTVPFHKWARACYSVSVAHTKGQIRRPDRATLTRSGNPYCEGCR